MVFSPNGSRQEGCVFFERIPLRHLECRPELVIGTGSRRIGGTQHDMPAEGVVLKQVLEGAIEPFGGYLPGAQGSFGQARGQQRLTDPADDTGGEHRLQALEDDARWQIGQSGDFADRVARVSLEAVFADGQNAGVDRVGRIDGNPIRHRSVWGTHTFRFGYNLATRSAYPFRYWVGIRSPVSTTRSDA